MSESNIYSPPSGDATFITTLVNVILSGCSMNASTFALMGKADPQFQVDGNVVQIQVPEGIYTVTVAYAGPGTLAKPMAVPGFPPPPAPPMAAPDTPPAM